MRLVRDDDGKPKLGNILIMLALTVASGYLASKSQRAGASAVQIPPKVRYYHAVQVIAGQQVQFWTEIQKRAATRYDIARL
jgi:hypothetical protein